MNKFITFSSFGLLIGCLIIPPQLKAATPVCESLHTTPAALKGVQAQRAQGQPSKIQATSQIIQNVSSAQECQIKACSVPYTIYWRFTDYTKAKAVTTTPCPDVKKFGLESVPSLQ